MMKKRGSALSRISFEDLFVETTKLVAKRSSCVKAQQAALLIKDNRVISFGYNGPPAGTLNCLEDGGEDVCGKDSNGSCFLGVHAEQNAIGYAARNGINTEGCIIYCTMTPCISCAKLVSAAGIKEFYYLTEYRLDDGLRFLEYCGIKAWKIDTL
ncbi:MAG: dCMP deaminase family protein [Thaumarchaeota archaeon]|nr:dCMP deaminase family protein [Nitrososphaerota archaeon]